MPSWWTPSLIFGSLKYLTIFELSGFDLPFINLVGFIAIEKEVLMRSLLFYLYLNPNKRNNNG